MSRWLSVEAACPGCERYFPLLLSVEGEPPAVGDPLPDQKCTHCDLLLHRVPSVPNRTKATFVDGTRRFGHLREEAALDVAISEARDQGEQVRALEEKQKLVKRT